MDWIPMETAPRDSTEFQAWDGCWIPRCRFNEDGEFEIYGRVDYDMDGWEVCSHLTPTHWMPQPSAPTPSRPADAASDTQKEGE